MQKKSHAFSCISQLFLIINAERRCSFKGHWEDKHTAYSINTNCKFLQAFIYCKTFSRKEDSRICEQSMMSCSRTRGQSKTIDRRGWSCLAGWGRRALILCGGGQSLSFSWLVRLITTGTCPPQAGFRTGEKERDIDLSMPQSSRGWGLCRTAA